MHPFSIRLGLAAILVLGLLMPMSTTLHADAGQDTFVPGEVILKLTSAAHLSGVTQAYGLAAQPLDQFGTRPIFRMQITDGAQPPDRAAQLTTDPRVQYAEPNYLEQTPEGRQRVSWGKGGDSGEYAGQWAGANIRLPEAQAVTRGAGIIVAVLDTGVDRTHPALMGKLLPGYDFVNLDTDPSEEGVYGQHAGFGHGTHVAGLVAFVAPEARILPVRVLDANGVGNIWVLAEALAYAANPDGNPATADGAHVINLSLSTTRRTDLLDEVIALVTCDDDDDEDDGDDGDEEGESDDDDTCLSQPLGTVVVAAAGNSASSNPEYPAAENVAGSLAISGSTFNNTLAPFSNFGHWVHVSAPGVNVLSTVPGGGYGSWSGTSMAAPLVAGTVALARAYDRGLSASGAADLILSKAEFIGGPVPLKLDAAATVGR